MASKAGAGVGVRVMDEIVAQETFGDGARVLGQFHIEVVRAGEVIDSFVSRNLVVDQGLNHLRDVPLLSGTQITAWYVALIDGTPTIAAGDTYATQAGWTEVTAYDEATREVWTGASGATGVATNSATRAEFTISTGGATVGGVALVGGGTAASTKGDTAGGGTLLSASAFTGGNRPLSAADVLRITWQATVANAA